MIYMYEPFAHTITKTTVKHLSYITGIAEMTIYQQKHKGQFNYKLNCFFTDKLPRIKKKQEINELIKVSDEVWKFNEHYQLYVSNLGRFKTLDGQFKFANNNKGSLNIIHKNKHHRASDIVFKTFIAGIQNGMHAYPKNRIYNDITADNLFVTSFKKYRLYRTNKGCAKAVYLVDSNNNIVEEYSSTREAGMHLHLDRTNVSRKCNRNYVEDGLMFMWATDYKEVAI